MPRGASRLSGALLGASGLLLVLATGVATTAEFRNGQAVLQGPTVLLSVILVGGLVLALADPLLLVPIGDTGADR